MSDALQMIAESAFNIAYLITVWALVVLMTRRLPEVAPEQRRTAGMIRLAFMLLAAGDTGHVGFRVVAYALGGLDTERVILGTPMNLVGIGMLTTAVTVTLFYMVLVYVWQFRYRQPANALTNLLLAAGIVRLIMMALPGNDWGSLVPPQPMSTYRNLPLVVQGLGVLGLILRDAIRRRDTAFQWVGIMIAVSFAFYLPVILWAQQVPQLGLLMIPKTCAYLVIAFVAYRALWPRPAVAAGAPT